MSTNELPEVKTEESNTYLYKWYIRFYNADDSDDKSKDINPVYLSSFTLVKKYKTETIPQIFAKMKLRIKDIMTLKTWQKKCLVDVTCKILIFSPTENNTMTQVDSDIVFSSTFIPIFNSTTFKSKYRKEDAERLEDAADGLETGETIVNMILLNDTAQNALKKTYNEVLEESTVGTAVQWMTCELDIKGAIIDTPDNTSTNKDIVIPPMTYVQAMNFLQANYGIYENGLMIFYDINGILYVLDKFSYEHDCIKDTSTLTKLFKTEAYEGTVGAIIRKCGDDKTPQYIGAIKLERKDNEVLEGELTGKTIVFSSFQQGMDSIAFDNEKGKVASATNVSAALTRNIPTNEVSGDKILTEYDELNNIYNMSSYFNELEAMTQRVSASLNNVNINDFAPNVIVELGFENVERNNEQAGQYFLNEIEFIFDRLKNADNLGTGASNEDEKDYKYPPSITTCIANMNLSRANPEK